jgi:hypothetical protein
LKPDKISTIKVKAYQVKQVRGVILKYGLGGGESDE